MSERIQKLLAQAGFGSRREIEEWLRAGRVRVNDELAQLGDKAGAGDKIELDGRVLVGEHHKPARPRYLAYNKPVGQICTRSDPEGRATVFAALPRIKGSRWVAVGRLDINSSGLMLFTTDGQLANALMHPSREVLRTYAVRVAGDPSDEEILALQQGVTLEDGQASFESIEASGGQGLNHWFQVTLKEGRKREVRRLWQHFGYEVSRLIRLAYGPISLGRDLRQGFFRDLSEKEIRLLYDCVGMQSPVAPEGKKRRYNTVPRRRRGTRTK